jgi:hypothetical protein
VTPAAGGEVVRQDVLDDGALVAALGGGVLAEAPEDGLRETDAESAATGLGRIGAGMGGKVHGADRGVKVRSWDECAVIVRVLGRDLARGREQEHGRA